MLAQKITALRNYCQTNDYDYLLLLNFNGEIKDKIIQYLLLQNPENTLLIIPRVGRPLLFCTPFEVAQNQEQFPEFIVYPLTADFPFQIKNNLPPRAKIAIRENIVSKKLYNELIEMEFALVPALKLEAVPALKNSAEILAMRAVIDLTDLCFVELIRKWSNFSTADTAVRFVSQFAFAHNATISFPTIIASGKNASRPHHITTAEDLTRGFCVVDLGLKKDGYCSDMTRTIFIGSASESERALYERIKNIQNNTIAQVVPGVKMSAPDIFCRAELQELNQYFIHGLGHGVGTEVHEWPAINKNNPEIFLPGMIITIEPGIYKDNEYGIRIEDDVLVTLGLPEVLTKSSKELICVPLPQKRSDD